MIKNMKKYRFKITQHATKLLSCQPIVTVMSCFFYKVNRDLESIDHLCINPIASAQVECTS